MEYKLGDKILNCRKHKKLSQQYCSEVCGIDLNQYISWENCAEVPSDAKLVILANLFEVDFDSLVDATFDLILPDYIEEDLQMPLKIEISEEISTLNDDLKPSDIQNQAKKGNEFDIKKFLNIKYAIILCTILLILCAILIIPKFINHGDMTVTNIMSDINRLSSGDDFTIKIEDDNTVIGTGNNSEGQIKVSHWEDVVMVRAGSNFSLGLLKNGSIVATGNNSYNQLEITNEQNIVDIDAGNAHAVVLDNENKVRCYGDNSKLQCDVDEWENVIAISANENVTAAITSDNKLLVTGKYNFETNIEIKDIEKIEVSENYIFLISSKGIVTFSNGSNFDFSEIEKMSNVKDIKTSLNHVLILNSNGRTYAFGDNSNEKLMVDDFKNAISIAVGIDNSMILNSDLKIEGVGVNDYKQFSKDEVEKETQLNDVENLRVEIKDNVRLDWDAVDNADYYLVEILENKYSVKVKDNKVSFSNEKFIDLNEYTVMVTAYTSKEGFKESTSVQFVFTYNAPVIEETLPPIVEIIPTSEPTIEPTPTVEPTPTIVPSIEPTVTPSSSPNV